MARLFTLCVSLLLISLLLVTSSPTALKQIYTYFKFDYETSEKFGETENSEQKKSTKITEFIAAGSHTIGFKPLETTPIFRILTPNIPSSILEIRKRPPQNLS